MLRRAARITYAALLVWSVIAFAIGLTFGRFSEPLSDSDLGGNPSFVQ